MALKPTYLPILKLVAQKHDNDCGVAALASITGKSYEDVFYAFGAPVHKTGVEMGDIVAAAAKLGIRMRLKRRIRLDEDTGILGVKTPNRTSKGHVVVLEEGRIYDTDLTVWDAEDFLKAEDATPTSIIVFDHRKRR